MKTATIALLTCLAVPLSAGAKGKPKAPETTELQAIKGKLIDMAPGTAEAGDALISTEMSGRDVEFFTSANALGALEAWLGEQAHERGEGDKVKAVGDALQSTQTEENELLHKLAKRKGVALPEESAHLAGHKGLQDRLFKASGASFDKAVIEEIGLVAQQAVDVYQKASSSKDADIQRFATQILPMVKEKLVLANKLAGKPLPPGAKPTFRTTPPPAPPPTPVPRPLPSRFSSPAPGTPGPRLATPVAASPAPGTPGPRPATPVAASPAARSASPAPASPAARPPTAASPAAAGPATPVARVFGTPPPRSTPTPVPVVPVVPPGR